MQFGSLIYVLQKSTKNVWKIHLYFQSRFSRLGRDFFLKCASSRIKRFTWTIKLFSLQIGSNNQLYTTDIQTVFISKWFVFFFPPHHDLLGKKLLHRITAQQSFHVYTVHFVYQLVIHSLICALTSHLRECYICSKWLSSELVTAVHSAAMLQTKPLFSISQVSDIPGCPQRTSEITLLTGSISPFLQTIILIL